MLRYRRLVAKIRGGCMYVCCVGGDEISVAFLFLLDCFETFSFSPTWACFLLLKKGTHFFVLASSHRYMIIQ